MAWLGMNVPKCEQLSADLGSSTPSWWRSPVRSIARSARSTAAGMATTRWRSSASGSSQHQQVVAAAEFIEQLKTTLDQEIAQQKRTSK